MKRFFLFLTVLAALSASQSFAAACGPAAVSSCNHDEYRYTVWAGENRIDQYCYTWDQVLTTLKQLVDVGSCTQGASECIPRAKQSCAGSSTEHLYDVFVNGAPSGNYCQTWEQALASVRDLRAAGVCP